MPSDKEFFDRLEDLLKEFNPQSTAVQRAKLIAQFMVILADKLGVSLA